MLAKAWIIFPDDTGRKFKWESPLLPRAGDIVSVMRTGNVANWEVKGLVFYTVLEGGTVETTVVNIYTKDIETGM
jgi:hypothetical protein